VNWHKCIALQRQNAVIAPTQTGKKKKKKKVIGLNFDGLFSSYSQTQANRLVLRTHEVVVSSLCMTL